MWANPQESADLVTVTEEILNGKLHFLCSDGLERNKFAEIVAVAECCFIIIIKL